jgi:ATP-dependent DNA ligase I
VSGAGTLAGLVDLAGKVAATPRKSEKVALIAELLRESRGRVAELCALYLSGTLPQGRIGVGWRALQGALPRGPATGPALTLPELDQAFTDVQSERGAGSLERKLRRLRALLERAGEGERRFLAGLLLGELRQGALDGIVLDAIALAAALPAPAVRQAAMYSGNLGEVARVALEEGAAALSRFGLRLLSPVAPMLASSAEDADEALERMGQAAFEYKLDGARIQLHRDGDEVRVFTRQLQDVTARVPELVEWARGLPQRQLVLEGETLALRADGRPQPFQVTMRRLGRFKDVEAARRALPLSSFFFDCLFVHGEGSLVSLAYAERAERLARLVPETARVPRIVTAQPEVAAAFLARSLEAGHEGLMAKSLTAPYAAGQRGSHWLKLKAAHSLDLVVLAVEWGSGRRKGWLSNLHLGARDAESGQFVMLGKTFKGLTDEMLRWQTGKLLCLESQRDASTVYVRPELVVEVAFSGVQESPRYPAGLALRFARVKRYREDKPAAQADTLQSVRRIFEGQRA